MPIADPSTYLRPLVTELHKHWPTNRAVNVVCHGHSVPAGYFATPRVDAVNAYPRLLHDRLLARFPFAVINVIVTAIGGENSLQGAARFEREVLCHRPDVVTIDYALNDRGHPLDTVRAAWTAMIDQAQAQGSRVILLTPTAVLSASDEDRAQLSRYDDVVRELAAARGIGLADSAAAFKNHAGEPSDLMSWSNHPNRAGHELVARELLRWFPPA
jgi:acyl-CoA thioesterase-1